MSISKINISEFSKHIFRNYKDRSELNEEIMIDNVLLHGEMKDYRKLLSLVDKKSFIKAVEKLEKSGKYNKRINFIKKIIL